MIVILVPLIYTLEQNTHKKDKTYQTHWKNILAYKNANELLIQIP